MIISSIIPIWLMLVICVIGIIFVKKTNQNKNQFIKKCLIIFLMFLINLRISIPSKNGSVVTNDLDVLFVIDNTISMIAEDYPGNRTRLSALKEDCEYIIKKLNGARFSVIKFSDSAQLLIPFTKDSNITIEAIETISVPSSYYAKGSTLNVALEGMIEQLEASNKKEDRKTILFFISDGEITNEDKLKSFSSAKKYIQNGAVLGYGTTKGGNMKVLEYDEEKYLIDYTSPDFSMPKAVSKIDEDNLKSIASDMGIDYIHMDKQSNIDYKLKQIEKLINTSAEKSSKNSYVDTYYIFALPLLILLASEFVNYKRKL